jgi:hypothetical protein
MLTKIFIIEIVVWTLFSKLQIQVNKQKNLLRKIVNF